MNGILLSAIIENVSTRKDQTVKITIGTQELSPSKAGEVFGLHGKLAVVYISSKDVPQREIDQVDKLEPELNGKTQSQRIRNTLFVLFTQDSEGFKDFQTYYISKTERFIEDLKTQILP